MTKIKSLACSLCLLFLFSSCGVILRTVEAPEYKKDNYDNILVVMNANDAGLTNTIAREFDLSIRENKSDYPASVEVYIDQQQSFGRVFSDNLENQMLNQKVQEGNYDLIISIRPISLSTDKMYVYEAVAIDTQNQKEVWGAAIDTVSSKRPKKYGKSLGKNLLKQLREDGFIR